jgi:hypothetical protein
MTSRPFPASLGLIALWLVLPTAGHAECVSPGFNPSGRFCNGCKYEGAMSMSRDQTCERVYTPGGGLGAGSTNQMSILSNHVIQRARHGIAGANGNTFAYSPNKGFSGTDDFVVEVAYKQGNESGKFTVHWNVTVQ